MQLSNKRKVFWIKFIHTIVYIVMVIGIFYILYSGITKTYDIWLYISLALLASEVIVFVGSGMSCPFTTLAIKYGDATGYVGDKYVPKKVADGMFYFFVLLSVIGILILSINYLHLR